VLRQEDIMRRSLVAVLLGVTVAGAVAAQIVVAQHQPAEPKPVMHGTAGPLTMPGQDAFGAIAEVVRILDADPATDWTRVDIERLRQHLIDMNEVVLRSAVGQTSIPGGLAMEITGAGRTAQAIRAMVVPHAVELDRMPSFAARTETIPDGVRLTVVARKPDDPKAVARIRGLGFAGLLTEGAHHQPHHLAMARGQAPGGHAH
jgi:hypothetical protein